MVAIGESLELSLTDLNHAGQGVGRHEGQVIFVPGGLPGESVRVRTISKARRHVVAQLEAILQPSPDRRRPPCILADHCGGCSLQPLADTAQQHWKEESVRQALRRLGRLEAPIAPLLCDSDHALGYRNRAVIPLERTPDGRLRAGFYRRGSHRIVNMNRCPVLDPRIDALIEPLKAEIGSSGWPVDRHLLQGGGLRHLALRVGAHTGEVLITLIASHDDLLDLAAAAARWMERWPSVVGVGLNLQSRASNLLFGATTVVVAGRGWIEETFAGLPLRIGADTFFQVNTRQAERLVPLIREALGSEPGHLIDAYCGIGTFSLSLANEGWRVTGLEQHPGAVAIAEWNAELLGLASAVRFVAGDVRQQLPDLLAEVDALFLDPPRRGLDPTVLAAIVAAPPPRLLYLSCDPATLARDLALLCAEGGSTDPAPYTLIRVQPIDFFPNTTHVEVLAVLERRQLRSLAPN